MFLHSRLVKLFPDGEQEIDAAVFTFSLTALSNDGNCRAKGEWTNGITLREDNGLTSCHLLRNPAHPDKNPVLCEEIRID